VTVLAAIGGSGGRTTGPYARHNELTDAGRNAMGYGSSRRPFEIDSAGHFGYIAAHTVTPLTHHDIAHGSRSTDTARDRRSPSDRPTQGRFHPFSTQSGTYSAGMNSRSSGNGTLG
jgi:hypothetical protein